MFIRKKQFDGRTYYYLVMTERQGSKVKQVTLKYLGKDKPSKKEEVDIIKAAEKELAKKKDLR